jgi:hypothetical protein
VIDERISLDSLLPEKKWFPGVVVGAGKQTGCEGGGHSAYDIMYKDSMFEREVRSFLSLIPVCCSKLAWFALCCIMCLI